MYAPEKSTSAELVWFCNVTRFDARSKIASAGNPLITTV